MSAENSDVEMDTDNDNDECYNYYNTYEDLELADPKNSDPEYFEFQSLTVEEVEIILNESVESLCASIPMKPSIAKLLLHLQGWSTSEIIASYRQDASKLFIDLRIESSKPVHMDPQAFQSSRYVSCSICLLSFHGEHFHALACGHYFCKNCWSAHFRIQIYHGITTTMECMSQVCNLLVPDDFVLNIIKKTYLRKKYGDFLFSDYVKNHPNLRFCPGQNCNRLIFAKEFQSKRVTCKKCKIQYCFKCGLDYHAPADCETIRRWITKCSDDSETANYICANTKDCPRCNICIEKNGGCNHMQCAGCKFHFCWICLKDWSLHDQNNYICSMYESSNTANGSAQTEARLSLKKYLFHFQRWENHGKSLKLEKETLNRIKDRISKKVNAKEGTWIDWQYLIDAADLLAKCRYTLYYTYPCAYFMESGPSLTLFKYQQAQLEAEIENLSWKIERAETTDRADLENQMYVAEKRRITLLKDFLVV